MITLDLPQAGMDAAMARGVRSLGPFLARAEKAVPVAGEVSVLLTSDRAIRKMNRGFRGKDRATDVLSFPAAAVDDAGVSRPASGMRGTRLRPGAPPLIAGDLAISVDTAARQAAQFGHTLTVELKILLLHGLLHLAGYDHEADAGEMAAREEELRRRFRLPATLIARSSAEMRGRGPG